MFVPWKRQESLITYCHLINPIWSEEGRGAFKAYPPPKLCPHVFNFSATLFCFGYYFSPKIVSHYVAIWGVSKYIVDVILIIFREFKVQLGSSYEGQLNHMAEPIPHPVPSSYALMTLIITPLRTDGLRRTD